MDQPEVADGVRGKSWRRPLLIAACMLSLAVAVGWVAARAGGVLLRTNALLARGVGNPPPVSATVVTREEISEVSGGTTLAEPFLSTSINVAVSEGRVKTVKVEPGKLVKPDAVLLEFDTNVFGEALKRSKLEVEMARSELRKVEAEAGALAVVLKDRVAASRERVAYWASATETTANAYHRIKTLWEQKVVALVDVEQAKVRWDEARSALASAQFELVTAENDLKNAPVVAQARIDAARFKLGLAEQEVARAERDLANTTVTAPSGGIIAQRSVNPGEWKKSGEALFVLGRIDPIYAVAYIEQEKSPYVALEQSAEVVFDAYPTRVFHGKITRIEPSIDPVKRTFKVFVPLENASLELRPGMAAFARIRRVRQATLVPRLAVINPTGAPSTDATVFVLEDSKVSVRKVKLGQSEGLGRFEVLGGLRPGELVVIHGQQDLNSGDRVEAKIVERTSSGVSR